MNRRGDIALFSSIAVATLLSIIALYSFFTFNTNVQSNSRDIAEVVGSVRFSEAYVQKIAVNVARETLASGASDLKGEYQKRIAARDVQLEGAGNFFGKIRTGDFVFEERESKIVLEVKGLFVQSTRGLNSMKREFDVVERFEKKKE